MRWSPPAPSRSRWSADVDATLNLPPFPMLEWDGYFWTGSLMLPAWAGFQARRERTTSHRSPSPSDGSVSLNVMTPGDAQMSPSPEQAAALRHLVDHQQETRDAILRSVHE